MRLAAFRFPIVRRTVIACLALLLAGVTGAGAVSQADTPSTPEPDWGRQADLVLAATKPRLNLTDGQVTSLKPILERHLKKLRGLFDQYAGQGVEVLPALLGEFREARRSLRANLEPILNPAQLQELPAIRAEVDQEIRKAFSESRLKRMSDRLGLSAEQAAAVRPILGEEYDRRLAILSFHIDAQGGPETRRPLSPELQQIREESDARLRAVLTPAQMESYLADRAPAGAARKSG